MTPLEVLRRAPLFSQPPLAIAVNVTVFLAILVIAASVVADFRAYLRQDRPAERSDRSLVETGSMTAFFVAYYLCVRFWRIDLPLPGAARSVLIVVGLAVVLFGAAFNVYGRLALKANWANQIKIYEGHTLVVVGPYRIVRHPLYASLIWMFIAAAFVYANPPALAATLGVFVPMMYVRARKEERLLLEAFPGAYEEYRQRTGMFFPRLRGR